jgi:hypothetical protein
MIEKGIICTIWPDNQVQYEITNIKTKVLKIKIDNKIVEETNHFVDLKEINGNSTICDVSLNFLTF